MSVDRGLCALTGQCATVAPDVFWFEGDELSYDPAPGTDQREAVEHAVALCPMAAVSVTTD